MRKLQNTLYITTQGTYLSKEGLAIRISRKRADGEEEKESLLLPSHNLSGIVCFGRVSCSPALMKFCAENEILISFLEEDGRFLARVEGPVSGNVLLRKAQYRAAESPERSVQIVSFLLAGKIANERAVLRRFLRERNPADGEIIEAESGLSRIIAALPEARDVDSLRGLEGKAADFYFSVFSHLILEKESPFEFHGRNRRPPQDMINALLSFGYTILLHEVIAGLETVGLDPAAGFLHCDRPGRPSLALDLLEEFRAALADRFVLSLINQHRIGKKDFQFLSNGAVLLNDEGRKTFLSQWQRRKQEEIQHPFLKEKLPVGLLFFVQSRILAKYLRGELDYYVPFVWK